MVDQGVKPDMTLAEITLNDHRTSFKLEQQDWTS
jgi:hypothetical protein